MAISIPRPVHIGLFSMELLNSNVYKKHPRGRDELTTRMNEAMAANGEDTLNTVKNTVVV